MHRADYQRVLVDEARRLGAQLRLGADVVKVECNNRRPSVILGDGEEITADIVVGADGLRSEVRTSVLGYVQEPKESGDLAYRITIPRELLENESDPFISGVVNDKVNAGWWGQNSHVVLYSVRADQMANLVLMYGMRLTIDIIIESSTNRQSDAPTRSLSKSPNNKATWQKCTRFLKTGIPESACC